MYFTIEMDSSIKSNSAANIMVMVIIVIAGLIALYFLYGFLFGNTSVQSTVIIPKDIMANREPTGLPAIPGIFEGGDYSVSIWLYVNSYNINRNRRKHILEIGGSNFSTLLIALGAFKNTLVVRTHSQEADITYSGTDSYGNITRSSTSNTNTPNSQDSLRLDGSLTPSDIKLLFKPLAMDDTLLDVNPTCDLPEIDMQRWTHLGVVLSGRTIDVYLDGKLTRSCITKSYYKVDPTGVTLKMLQKASSDSENGFDGHISNLSLTNFSLSPSDMYRIYSNGPFGTSAGVSSWMTNLFRGS